MLLLRDSDVIEKVGSKLELTARTVLMVTQFDGSCVCGLKSNSRIRLFWAVSKPAEAQ